MERGHDSNLNHSGKTCPNSSEPTPRSDLAVDDAQKSLTILELGSGTGIAIAKLAEIINRGDPASQFLPLITFEDQSEPWYR